jgi:hypothetical protein
MSKAIRRGDALAAIAFRLREGFGRTGAVAIVALLGAAAWWALVQAPRERLAHEPVPLEAPASGAESPVAVQPAPDPDAAARRLRASLPGPQRHAADLEALLEVAARAGVKLEQGRLRVVGEPGDSLQRIEVELRVTERWPALRALLAQAMNRMPHLALKTLKVTRESAESEQVEAQLVFAWIYRDGSVAPSREPK